MAERQGYYCAESTMYSLMYYCYSLHGVLSSGAPAELPPCYCGVAHQTDLAAAPPHVGRPKCNGPPRRRNPHPVHPCHTPHLNHSPTHCR